MSYTNADGLQVLTFKDQGAVQNQGATVYPPLNYIVLDIDLADLDAAYTADPLDPVIPAGSTITRAVAVTKEAAAGGTSINIGLYNASTDAAVDADGVFAAAALADFAAVGDTVQGAGALVGSGLGTSANDTRVGIVPTGTFTAGKVKVFIEYFV